MIVRTLEGQTFMRLAFPIRSAVLATLVDTDDERSELDTLRAATSVATGEDPWTYVHAPFASPTPSRFSDGTYGVLYAANSFVTAVRESAYHLGRVYADGRAPAMETRRIRLGLHLAGDVVDARRKADAGVDTAIYNPDPHRYGPAQAFGAQVRSRSAGLHYDSVRNPQGGHCIAAFSSALVRAAHVAGACALVWDGRRFAEEHEIRAL